jgi:hypothetical protein
MALSTAPPAATISTSVKALDIDSCRHDVQRAAIAKVVAGKNLPIRQCLLDAGFCEDQANNRTMQMRVRRQVQKLLRPTTAEQSKQNEALPMEISCDEEDTISVLTIASCLVVKAVTPIAADALPSSICIPGNFLVPSTIIPQRRARVSPELFPPSLSFDFVLPLAPPPPPPTSTLACLDLLESSFPKRTLDWMPEPPPPKRRHVICDDPMFTLPCAAT